MATQISTGGLMMCSFGMAPMAVNVLPTNRVMATTPAGNILDNKPFVTVPPFAMCTSLANPTVASATAAALGVLTPMPCTPMVAAPGCVGSIKVLLGKMPALDLNTKFMCSYGGMIQFSAPGQFKVQDA